MTQTYDGGCECGAVRYRLTSDPIVVNCCHCRDCQRITGSAFAINAMIETDRIELLAGEPHVVSLGREGSGPTHAWRCATCEALLYADHPMIGDGVRFVRVGTLDEGEALPPDVHFFLRSKHPWVRVPNGMPAYDALPEGYGPGVELNADRQARLDRALA